MREGKLTNEQLKSLVLSKLRPKADVLLRSGVGEDCAAIDFGGTACVLSTDPVTGAVKNAGRLAVIVSCNDVASSGARPFAMLATVLIPPDKTAEDIEKAVDQIVREADRLGVDIIGGHTEITGAVDRIVISTTAIGRIESGRLVRSGGASPGDDLIMTGCAGIEGTYIIAAEHEDELSELLSEEDRAVIGSLENRLSVIEEGVTAAEAGASAMHDVTEGGVYGAVYELCEASGTGCELYAEKIPVLDVTRKICGRFGIDPMRLIGSGSMLIAAPDAKKIRRALSSKGIESRVIGRITDEGVYVVESGLRRPLPPPGPDELFSI